MTAFLVFILLLHRKLLSKTLFTTLHHSSPSSFFRKTHYLSNVLVFYYDQLQSSMMAELRDKVKSCEEL